MYLQRDQRFLLKITTQFQSHLFLYVSKILNTTRENHTCQISACETLFTTQLVLPK